MQLLWVGRASSDWYGIFKEPKAFPLKGPLTIHWELATLGLTIFSLHPMSRVVMEGQPGRKCTSVLISGGFQYIIFATANNVLGAVQLTASATDPGRQRTKQWKLCLKSNPRYRLFKPHLVSGGVAQASQRKRIKALKRFLVSLEKRHCPPVTRSTGRRPMSGEGWLLALVMVSRQSSTGGGKWSGVKSPELPVWPPPSASTTTTSTRSATSTSASSTSSTSASQRRGTPDARVHLPLTGSVHTLVRSPCPVSTDPCLPCSYLRESVLFLLCKYIM